MRNLFALCPLPFAISAALACGCTAVKPLKGGRAATIHTPSGVVQQTLAQGENPSAASRQAQEIVRVRTYTLPPGTRIEQSPVVFPAQANTPTPQNSNTPQVFVLSAPMLVAEREETRAQT